MKLEDLLLQKKTSILERWFRVIVETYPPETAKFLKKQKDRFANPVGAAIFQGISGIFDQICQEINLDEASPFLDKIVRTRAIQDFSPSQAVAFIFLLKHVIREELENEIRENQLTQELFIVESRIDDLALLSFNIYMKCREQIYEMRFNEVRNKTYSLLKKANLLYEIPESVSGGQHETNTDNLTPLTV
ncbi:MAG: RsbRD N-terminal domain-containing protein [Deltaproteobacteria bacterium]|nr:RsbRD N-terminal domain-containing protein [Deltaproteobacteria bacterium]